MRALLLVIFSLFSSLAVAQFAECVSANLASPETVCERTYEPVCGCNEKTYANTCEAKKAGVTSWTQGPCTVNCIVLDKVDAQRPCPKDLRPVCGCDGKTYSNVCEAEKAGLQSWVSGVCPESCVNPKKVNEKQVCPDENEPVCGCDGKDYTNPCEAEKAGVTNFEKGKCSTCIDPYQVKLIPAPAYYKPVCGCDGNTYNNEVAAQYAGLKSWTEGPCTTCVVAPTKKSTTATRCPDIYEPVCGCNGKTYANECAAKAEGVLDVSPGACNTCVVAPLDKQVDCPENWEPVCGCNGTTYSNECAAENAGVKSWVKGECETCVDKKKKTALAEQICPAKWDPVCGCDGTTYSNECEAVRAGLSSWLKGKCQ